MQNLKTQFEVRYSTLLNFKTDYKLIFAPYLKNCEFTVNNSDTIKEYIVLVFKEEKYIIDCRWDRIVFTSEGIRDDLKKSQGPFFTFFEIFEKLKNLDAFGEIKNVLLAEWNLIEYEKSLEEIKKLFRKSFLSDKSFNSTRDLPNEDFSVTFTYGDQNDKFQRCTFGPFVPKKDVANYDLIPITKNLSSEFEGKKGILSESLYFEKTLQANFDSYKKASRSIESFLKEIQSDE